MIDELEVNGSWKGSDYQTMKLMKYLKLPA